MIAPPPLMDLLLATLIAGATVGGIFLVAAARTHGLPAVLCGAAARLEALGRAVAYYQRESRRQRRRVTRALGQEPDQPARTTPARDRSPAFEPLGDLEEMRRRFRKSHEDDETPPAA